MFNYSNVEEKIAKLKEQFKEQEVVVRVWTSEHNIRKKGMHGGFVSLELTGLNKNYISFIRRDGKNNLYPEQDIESLGRKPEYVFHFYTLDQKSILDKAKIQDLTVSRKPEDSADYIWKLLQAGGIENLISRTDKILGKIQEAAKGKAVKIKNEKVLTKKAVGLASQITSLFKPEQKLLIAGINLLNSAIIKSDPTKELQKSIKGTADGAYYSYRSLFDGYKVADNIVKPLQIAQEYEEEKNNFIKELNDCIKSENDNESSNIRLTL